jgi:restriction system protein
LAPEQFLDELRRLALDRTVLESLSTEQIDDGPSVQPLIVCSPSVAILIALRQRKITLSDIRWRDFEEIVAELLRTDGFEVALQRGSRDDGYDIIARATLKAAGSVVTLWQAKHLTHGKVEVTAVRELADVRQQYGANKAMIVTSSYLTRGALARIEREKFLLGKRDRDEVVRWIDAYGGRNRA